MTRTVSKNDLPQVPQNVDSRSLRPKAEKVQFLEDMDLPKYRTKLVGESPKRRIIVIKPKTSFGEPIKQLESTAKTLKKKCLSPGPPEK